MLLGEALFPGKMTLFCSWRGDEPGEVGGGDVPSPPRASTEEEGCDVRQRPGGSTVAWSG